MLFEAREPLKTFIEIPYPIKPAINVAPGARPLTNYRQVSFADDFIDGAVRFGKEIAQIHLEPAGRNTLQPIAHTARRAVVTLPETGGENQDFFHDSLGKRPRRETDASLMDI